MLRRSTDESGDASSLTRGPDDVFGTHMTKVRWPTIEYRDLDFDALSGSPGSGDL